MPPKTYLRVRRRRNAGTALTLRLDGLEDESSYWEDKVPSSSSSARQPAAAAANVSRKRSAVWRRVDAEDPDETSISEACRVVEAILSDSDEEDNTNNNNSSSLEAPCKRRRLTLVQPSRPRTEPSSEKASKSPKKGGGGGFKILHPLERLVDESLQAVAIGTLTPRQHADFIWTDTRVSHQVREWLTWRNAEIGTLLHAAALWNDAELTADLLRMDLPQLVDALDGEGRTPYEVAELSGNEHVQQVMEAFGADTKNFVYDLYCLEGHDDDNNNDLVVDGETTDENQMACLLKNGMGYWNQDGDLMFERETSAKQKTPLENAEDEDSNDEDWLGNDYPEEGYWPEENSEEGDLYPGEARPSGFMDGDDGDFDYAYGIYEQDKGDIIRQF